MPDTDLTLFRTFFDKMDLSYKVIRPSRSQGRVCLALGFEESVELVFDENEHFTGLQEDDDCGSSWQPRAAPEKDA